MVAKYSNMATSCREFVQKLAQFILRASSNEFSSFQGFLRDGVFIDGDFFGISIKCAVCSCRRGFGSKYYKYQYFKSMFEGFDSGNSRWRAIGSSASGPRAGGPKIFAHEMNFACGDLTIGKFGILGVRGAQDEFCAMGIAGQAAAVRFSSRMRALTFSTML
jgi:hypothetical protein